ncbi:MAG: response regulator transcription factor [Candidatus Pacebacteria bacterium]|nr:response regulator transcription factor [Candidatus Paceibacterota bacterium]
MRLLIVEDNLDFQSFLKLRLEEKSFAVDAAKNGTEGLTLATTHPYDLILLDYSLPGKNGYEICTELRERGISTPVIMISGTGDVFHKVDGFTIGVDDYLVKPFFFEELFARIGAVLRRPHPQTQSIISFADLEINLSTQKVIRAKREIYLTKKEFALLQYLLRNSEMLVTRGELLEHVWDAKVDANSNTIEAHITNLRKKIDLPRKKKLIHSLSGRGYKLGIAR